MLLDFLLSALIFAKADFPLVRFPDPLGSVGEPDYRVPQKKVGLVEIRLWQILMLIVRNPKAILDKSI